MKSQYLGDVNDYFKYGLLRGLLDGNDLVLTVAWMLTSDDGGPDGRKLGYLDRPNDWEGCDSELYGELRQYRHQKARRDILDLEEARLLPRARYFTRLLADAKAARQSYFEDLAYFARGSDVVFFDPDNGLEIESTPRGKKESSRYLFWDETTQHWEAGRSLVVYQHFRRVQRSMFVRDLCGQCRDRFPGSHVEAVTTSHALFLILIQNTHLSALKRGLDRFQEAWASRLKSYPS